MYSILFKKITELSLLHKSNPMLAIIITVSLFSVAGIPPLVGFYSKFYVFTALISNNMLLIALIASILSVVACMYYIRLIKIMYFNNNSYWAFLYEIS